ncbi:unnamed protein product [Cunninghamella echinulata]
MEIRDLMSHTSNIRNVSVIGHTNHGKSTLKDILVAKTSITSFSEACQYELDNNGDDSSSMTFKSTIESMYYSLPNNNIHKDKSKDNENKKVDTKMDCKSGDDDEEEKHHDFDNSKNNDDITDEMKKDQQMESTRFLINLMDTPGHADFSSEATASLRLSDGALVVVDCLNGVCLQTENILRQALNDHVKPLLIINKMDRALLEYQLEQEELYTSFFQIIESINKIISTYADESLGNVKVYPNKNTVAFTDGLNGWGFTLQQFASSYSKKFGINEEKILQKLWGENYFNTETKIWSTKQRTDKDGKSWKRGFNLFVLDPIYRIFSYTLNKLMDKETLCNYFSKVNIQVTIDEIEGLEGKHLLKALMKRFLPCDKALLEMICIHLPSPETAQTYRVPHLYQGPMDDGYARGMQQCNPQGPLMVYVSKIVPFTFSKDGGQFYAFGRVFSGTVRNGLPILMLDSTYKSSGAKKFNSDGLITTIQETFVIRGKYMVATESDCSAGNIVCLVCKDPFNMKSGTITALESKTVSSSWEKVYAIKRLMTIPVAPVVQMAVDVQDPTDLPKLIEGLKQLSLTDPSSCLDVYTNSVGEHVITAGGKLHLETSLKVLEKKFAQVPLKKAEKDQPWVSYRETITQSSSINCLAKSPNKRNRIYMRASPLDEDLIKAIEKDVIRPGDNVKQYAQKLSSQYHWDNLEAKNVWCSGPDYYGANLLVNETKGVQHLDVIKYSILMGFNWATKEGPLAEENLRGCRFNILDVVLFGDAIHRGGGQIIPTCRRVMYASVLTAQPALQEPIYLTEIHCPKHVLVTIYSLLHQHRGVLLSEEKYVNKNQFAVSRMVNVKAYIPVSESFGLEKELFVATAGQASFQLVFDHWSTLDGNPLESGNKAYDIVRELRQRKGLLEDAPKIENFLDKL